MGGSCSSDAKGKSADREKTTITLKGTKKPDTILSHPKYSTIMRRRGEEVIKI